MKVLLVQFSGRGGPQAYTWHLTSALAKVHDVYVLLAKHLANDRYREETKIICMSAPPSYLKMLLLLFNPRTYLFLLKCVRNINPNVIHAPNEFLWAALIFLFFKRYPVVITEHDPLFHKGTSLRIRLHIGFFRLFTRRMADAIIVHGQKLKKVLEQKGVPQEKIWVIPHGELSYYTRWAKNRNESPETKRVLFFGSISDYKGLEVLIEAAPLIVSEVPEAKVVIAGSGDFRKYRPLIKREDIFEIHNRFIPDEEVAEFFQKAAVVVLPYTEGTQTGVVPVAYSFRKPVVVTDVGVIPEMVGEGKTGFIVPPGDSKELANAIIRLLKDEKMRKTMGENGLRMANEELSWENIAEKTTKVYEYAIEVHRKRNQ